jgi:hypothetical protein
MREQEKMARRNGDNDTVRKLQLRLDTLEMEAVQLGFPILRDYKENRNGIGQVKPSITKLIHDQFGENNMYPILSGVAHSDCGILSQLAFSKSYNCLSDKVISEPTIPIELQTGCLNTYPPCTHAEHGSEQSSLVAIPRK